MTAVFSPSPWIGRLALVPGPAWSSHKGRSHPGLGAAPCRRFAGPLSQMAMLSATFPQRTNAFCAVDSDRALKGCPRDWAPR